MGRWDTRPPEGESATPTARGAVDPGEADLLAKAQGGNLFAFEEIVKRYQRRVYGTAMRILRRHDLADDVVQDAFLRAYQSLARFDRQRPFGPWTSSYATCSPCWKANATENMMSGTSRCHSSSCDHTDP